jgi:DtxR family Mn-dependent transcriptional regulator
MATEALTRAAEDYLKAIYVLEEAGVRVTTSALAERMGVSAPSATAMMKRLADLRLVERAPYRGVVLTEAGRSQALEVLRHHRLLELYLAESLGVPWDRVHDEAEVLEHVLSEELEDLIDEALGFPTHDPHGDPIPDRDLQIVDSKRQSLLDLAPGDRSTVSRVPDNDSDLLRYLNELALVPGANVELIAIAPFGGPISFRTANGEHAIARELARLIGVDEPVPAAGLTTSSRSSRGAGAPGRASSPRAR